MLDMIAALRWVQASISRLGGDPHNVTIAGESAGAAAVNDLLLAPDAHGLFHKAIAMSGSGMGVDVKPLAKAETYGRDFAARAGTDDIAALRAMDAARLPA
ncbi:carboxylesterase type B [Novosphingobium sp. 1529]